MWKCVQMVMSFLAVVITVSAICVFYAADARAGIVPEEEWNDTTKLWLARSVLGEAGWRREAEYSAIAYVYVARAEQSKTKDFLEVIKSYSAAVKSFGRRRNPWLFELGLDSARPSNWPMDDNGIGPRWEGLHDEAWLEVLSWADEWQEGLHDNPCPGANHYGGWVDRYRAEQARWVRIKCSSTMRNRFYTSLRRQGTKGR